MNGDKVYFSDNLSFKGTEKEKKGVQTTVSTSNIHEGNNSVRFEIDESNFIHETNELNNSLEQQFQVDIRGCGG